ncbi:hypothetical protein EV361DRAFT_944838 [Lentinula raphanica]|nr:hypothetical protein EV361DRAFT_944838 [Lentinula raphanica]
MDFRRRITFKADTDTEEDANYLDDQGNALISVLEQEEVIENLRKENAKSNEQSILMMKLIVLLSAFMHLIYFINPTDDPLLFLFPPSNSAETIPLPRPFTCVSLALHANLLLLLDPSSIRKILLQLGFGIDDSTDLRNYTLSPTLAYTLAFVAPTVGLFLRRPWLTVAWWSITVLVTYAVQSVLEDTASGNEHIRSLEALKYRAPGA